MTNFVELSELFPLTKELEDYCLFPNLSPALKAFKLSDFDVDVVLDDLDVV